MVPLITSSVVEFTGNGTASIFAIPYPVFEASNIVAEKIIAGIPTTLLIDVHYTLSRMDIPNQKAELTLVGGNLVAGHVLRISFSTDAMQPAKFRDMGRFSPEAFEKVLDRLTMNIKALKARIARGDTDVSVVLAGFRDEINFLYGSGAIQDTRLTDLEAAIADIYNLLDLSDLKGAEYLKGSYIAAHTMSALKLVRIFGSNSVVYADRLANFDSASVFGITLHAAVETAIVDVLFLGRVIDPSFTWPLNVLLFLDNIAGEITDSPGGTNGHGVQIGKSMGPGAILINIQQPIPL